jgi:hypothetical protein
MSKQVEISQIGAFSTDDDRYPDGYFLVEWCDEPRALQEDFHCNNYNPPMKIQKGELVCKGKYFKTVGRLPRWSRLT